MKIKNAFDTLPTVGTCKVNRKKFEKAFDINCRVLLTYDQDDNPKYQLIRFTPKATRCSRFVISKDDADWVISKFRLYEINALLGRYTVYVPCVIF